MLATCKGAGMPAALTKANTEGIKPSLMEIPLRICTKQLTFSSIILEGGHHSNLLCLCASLSRTLHSIEESGSKHSLKLSTLVSLVVSTVFSSNL